MAPYVGVKEVVFVDALGCFNLSAIVAQHAEKVSHLRFVRTILSHASIVQLQCIQRLDNRITAHLDGLAVAGEAGLKLCIEALAPPTAGSAFTLAVLSLESRYTAVLQRLFSIAESEPDAARGLLSAFGWVSAQTLQGTIRTLLTSTDPSHQTVALAACAMHRVDPGDVLVSALSSTNERLRHRALRVAGEVGRVDLLERMLAECHAEDASSRFWAARSALLLGDRSGTAVAALTPFAEDTQALSDAAAELLLKTLNLGPAHQHLRHWAIQANEPGPAGLTALRRLIRRCGILGDPQYIPWLIGQMSNLRFCRLAGESFSRITGADLAALDLERKPPEGAGDGLYGGPNDDPEDNNVAMDEDDGLPWPDPDRVQVWWQANQARFPAGQRFFVGAPPSPAQALKVLREGYQRQRLAAAQWACILTPGTKLFPTAAPAWRQQRWLAEMG